jgi:hypothetical protein
MRNIGYLLGGALAGAVGLTAAALLSEKKSDAYFSGGASPDAANSLGAEDVATRLNSYFFKATALALKCSSLSLESGELHCTPIDLPDDDFLTKVGNKIGGSLTITCRAGKLSSLRDLKKEAERLYQGHRNLFVRANTILERNGEETVSLKFPSLQNQDLTLNNSLSNDDWILDFDDLCGKVRDFINKTIEIAEKLIGKLEALSESKKTSIPAVTGNTAAAIA